MNDEEILKYLTSQAKKHRFQQNYATADIFEDIAKRFKKLSEFELSIINQGGAENG